MARIRIQNLGKSVAWLIRAIGRTLTFEVEDRAGVFDSQRGGTILSLIHI